MTTKLDSRFKLGKSFADAGKTAQELCDTITDKYPVEHKEHEMVMETAMFAFDFYNISWQSAEELQSEQEGTLWWNVKDDTFKTIPYNIIPTQYLYDMLLKFDNQFYTVEEPEPTKMNRRNRVL